MTEALGYPGLDDWKAFFFHLMDGLEVMLERWMEAVRHEPEAKG